MNLFLSATSFAPSYGGPAVAVARLGAALAARGAHVVLWAPDGTAMTSPLVERTPGLEPKAGALAAALRADRPPDLVHDNGLWRPYHHAIARFARRCGIPRLVTLHGMLEPWALAHRRWKKQAAWHVYQKRDLDTASTLHATAESEARKACDLGLRAPMVVVPNGVDLPAFDTIAGQPRGTSQHRRALFLSRIHPKKGLMMLLDAWAALRPARWELVVAGPAEGGHDRELTSRIAQLGLNRNVKLRGPAYGGAKTELLNSADLFVLPTHSENFGIVVAEALAHARPVLTTTASPWELLTTERCGWWTRPTPAGLAEGLAAAFQATDGERRAMGERGRAVVENRFAWAQIADEMHDRVYAPLLAGRDV